MRADAGFFSYGLIGAIAARGASYVIAVANNPKVTAALDAIGEDAWAPIAYTRGGQTQVAETTLRAGRSRSERTLRLVARRTRLVGAQAQMWPHWRHHAFVTNRDDPRAEAADACCRGHARAGPAIRDLKNNGLRHCPSGSFAANAAWLACAALAHNIARWCARTGRAHPPRQLTVTATARNRLLTVPARLVNHSGRHKLRLPANWPRQRTLATAPEHIPSLPLLI